MIDRKKEIRITFLIIATALGCWALFHVVGGYLGGSNDATGYPNSFRRAGVIAAVFIIFLGGWWLLIRARFNKNE